MVVFLSCSSRFDFVFATAVRNDSSVFSEAVTLFRQVSMSKLCSWPINSGLDADRESVLIKPLNHFEKSQPHQRFVLVGARFQPVLEDLQYSQSFVLLPLIFFWVFYYFFKISSALMAIWLFLTTRKTNTYAFPEWETLYKARRNNCTRPLLERVISAIRSSPSEISRGINREALSLLCSPSQCEPTCVPFEFLI